MTYLHQCHEPENITLSSMNFRGNIIPNSWYKRIVTTRGHQDTIAISVLSEIVYWYRLYEKGFQTNFSNGLLQLGYEHFEQKLNLSRNQIRDALLRLEDLKLVFKLLKTESRFGTFFSNVMYLRLNTSELTAITDIKGSDLEELCLLNKDFAIDSYKTNEFNAIKNSDGIRKFLNPSSEISEDNNKEEKKNNYKNRYLNKDISNFAKISLNDFSKNTLNQSTSELTHAHLKYASKQLEKAELKLPLKVIEKDKPTLSEKYKAFFKPIAELLPIRDEEVEFITDRVGREFGSTFVNALAQKLASKYSDKKFKSKEVFLNYMIKALSHEKHDPIKVNNINFAYSSKEDSYLERIESLQDNSIVSQVKKKISQEFDRIDAYNILTKCYFPNIVKETTKYKVYVNDEAFNLSQNFQEKITKLIKQISLKTDLTSMEATGIEEVNFIKGKLLTSNSDPININKSENIHEASSNEQYTINDQGNPIWKRIRERLIERYGIPVDRSWFGKLKFDYIDQEGRVDLIFPTKFMSDFCENNYGSGLYRTIVEVIQENDQQNCSEIVHKVEGCNYSSIVWKSKYHFN